MKINVFEGARRIGLAFGALWVVGCLAFAVFSTPYTALTYSVAWPGEPAVRAESCGSEDANEFLPMKTTEGDSIAVTLCFKAQRADDGRLLVPYARSPATAKDAFATWIVTNKDKRGTPEFERVAKAYEDPNSKPWELYQALRDADAKGDSARARQLTTEIRSLPPQLMQPRYFMDARFSSAVNQYSRAVADGFTLTGDRTKEAEKALWGARLNQWKDALQFAFGGIAVFWGVAAIIGWIARGFMGIPRGRDARP